ncbi:MAG TPA: MBL fold metallo-hydrolase, partial [Anaerolineales bacterium]|nr:MBL fold metallo-hydrolase [Anaerolineales bacterium]
MPNTEPVRFFPLTENFGRVHAYLLEDGDGLTLIDSLRDRGGKVILEAMARSGYFPAELRRIILTHAHPTHVNGAAALKRLSGAPVFGPVEELDIFEGRRPSNRTTWVPHRPFRILPQQFLLNLQNVLWNAGIRPRLLNVEPVQIDHCIEGDDEQ